MAGRSIDREKAKAAILQALRAASTRQAAYTHAGIDATTFHHWLAKYPQFAKDVREAEASWQIQAPALIIKSAINGSWQAAAFLLERHPQTKSQWKRIDQHDLASIPTHRLLQMLSASEDGIDSTGDRAAAAEAVPPAEPESLPG